MDKFLRAWMELQQARYEVLLKITPLQVYAEPTDPQILGTIIGQKNLEGYNVDGNSIVLNLVNGEQVRLQFGAPQTMQQALHLLRRLIDDEDELPDTPLLSSESDEHAQNQLIL